LTPLFSKVAKWQSGKAVKKKQTPCFFDSKPKNQGVSFLN
jgi:hypothetical protein